MQTMRHLLVLRKRCWQQNVPLGFRISRECLGLWYQSGSLTIPSTCANDASIQYAVKRITGSMGRISRHSTYFIQIILIDQTEYPY